LIVIGPKGLLRLPAASSTLSEMDAGTQFQPVLDDPFVKDPSMVERIYLLSGKFYYELTKARERAESDIAGKVALIRIEELCPFPYVRLREVLTRYPNAKDIRWAQEEPQNTGAWYHVKDRIVETLKQDRDANLGYYGRKPSAMPAPGSARVYKTEQEWYVNNLYDHPKL